MKPKLNNHSNPC